MVFEDRQIIAEFVVESRERLADVENQLLAIEAGGEDCDLELVNDVFRAVHSIKGAAGFLGFQTLGQLAHNLENVLNMVRNRQLTPGAQVTNAMLRSADALRKMLEDIDRSNETDITAYVDLLQNVVDGLIHDEAAEAPPPSGPPAAPAEPAAESAIAEEAPAMAEMPATNVDAPPQSAALQPGVIAESPVPTGGASVPSPEATSKSAPAAAPTTGTSADANIRVAVTVLDRLMNLAGELVLSRNQLLQSVHTANQATLDSVAARVNQVTTELQETIMQTRLQTLGTVFGKFPRVVRDLSMALGKECQLSVEGQEVELDKSIIEAIGDPLTHLIRNAVDHGLEKPEVRARAGKPRAGTIFLRACHQAGKVNISIRDDGAGIDAAKLKQKAVARGLLTAAQAEVMSDREAHQLIFRPGFSMAEKVTEISGRGVGMDVVKTNIERLGGAVTLETELGRGTAIIVKLPLTLAIVPSLIVCLDDRRYAIPQANISELVRVKSSESAAKIQRIKDSEVLRLRGELLPLVRLSTALGLGESAASRADRDTRNIIVLEAGHLRYGLVVDGLSDSEEIVVKPLGRDLKSCPCLAGATILGDGQVAFILDVAAIAHHSRLTVPDEDAAAADAAADGWLRNAEKVAVLLFRNDPQEQFAIPMQLIARLERIQRKDIQWVGGQQVLQYRGASLPLLNLDSHIRARPCPEAEAGFAVVFGMGKREVGLLVHEVVDIRELPGEVDSLLFREPGVIGSAILEGQPTRLLDLFELTQAAFPEWATTPTEAAKQQAAARTILLAEDSDFFRRQMQGFLEGAGYQVVGCEDGLVAWETLQGGEHEFHLVVTDIEMPRVDGLELTRRIRQDHQFHQLPIVAVTSLASDEDQQRGKQAGVDQYHVKLDRDKLLEAVNQLMTRAAKAAARAPAGDIGR